LAGKGRGMVVCYGRLHTSRFRRSEFENVENKRNCGWWGYCLFARTLPKKFACSGIPELFKKPFYNNNHAHDEENSCNEGDLVRVSECRPLSKTKNWQVVEIITRAAQ